MQAKRNAGSKKQGVVGGKALLSGEEEALLSRLVPGLIIRWGWGKAVVLSVCPDRLKHEVVRRKDRDWRWLERRVVSGDPFIRVISEEDKSLLDVPVSVLRLVKKDGHVWMRTRYLSACELAGVFGWVDLRDFSVGDVLSPMVLGKVLEGAFPS